MINDPVPHNKHNSFKNAIPTSLKYFTITPWKFLALCSKRFIAFVGEIGSHMFPLLNTLINPYLFYIHFSPLRILTSPYLSSYSLFLSYFVSIRNLLGSRFKCIFKHIIPYVFNHNSFLCKPLSLFRFHIHQLILIYKPYTITDFYKNFFLVNIHSTTLSVIISLSLFE